jgi:hypothetical protein
MLYFNKVSSNIGVTQMLKTNLKFAPVITIHLYETDKNNLQAQADKVGMQLATYCRMVLLNSLKEVK